MRYILKYKNFNESKGISDSCEKVLYELWNLIEDDILRFKNNKIIYNIDEYDFKVKDLKLEYSIKKSKNRFCYGATLVKETKIEEGSLINSKINLNIEIDFIDDEFIYYVKSVLLHELLHLFQHYNILKGNKFRPETFSIGSILPQLRKMVNTKYGEYFLDILYYSLPHELSAQLHQYYLYKLKNKEYKKIEQILNLLKNFKNKKLTQEEENDISLIKKHLLNSINFYTDNKNYLSNSNKSLWTIDNNGVFLDEFLKLLDKRIKWVNKKIILINKKLTFTEEDIDYSEYISLPTNWDDHLHFETIEAHKFITENLVGCPVE